MTNSLSFFLLVVILAGASCSDNNPNPAKPKNFSLVNLTLDGRPISYHYHSVASEPNVVITFSDAIDQQSATENIILNNASGNTVPLSYSFSNDSTIKVSPKNPLEHLSVYSLKILPQLKSNSNTEIGGNTSVKIVTAIDSTDKFQRITDDALLDLTQKQTFKYFWDFAEPASGMARERNTSGNLVTTGGSGFGLMAIIVGIQRGFVSRDDGLARLNKILGFLETADRFHGAWPHWIDGTNGKVIPFSSNDNGGDLVETSFLMQGLLTFRQYLYRDVVTEAAFINRINALWESVEWDWYTQGQHVLYWHWSPDKAWIMNQQIKGYNEALITYMLAASSPTHPIDAVVYHEGWASNGAIRNGKKFYDITLPLGFDYGGPLFFAHYSFLGLDPRTLNDTYANYWTQNVNHTLINHAYAVDNPKNFAGYSDESWGLTASDDPAGYAAHSPTNDLGVISPTAALSSMPYAPEESMKALRFFYYKLGDKLWGDSGFHDAYDLSEAWIADSYLAIDQGPIVIMIENYRTGLLWNLFMTSPDIQNGMTKIGFTN
jgi:hypothetical protein